MSPIIRYFLLTQDEGTKVRTGRFNYHYCARLLDVGTEEVQCMTSQESSGMTLFILIPTLAQSLFLRRRIQLWDEVRVSLQGLRMGG